MVARLVVTWCLLIVCSGVTTTELRPCNGLSNYLTLLQDLIEPQVSFLLDDTAIKMKEGNHIEDIVQQLLKPLVIIIESLSQQKYQESEDFGPCLGNKTFIKKNLTKLENDVLLIINILISEDLETFSKLRETGEMLLRFKLELGNEILRVMTVTKDKDETKDEMCGKCLILGETIETLESLEDCRNNHDSECFLLTKLEEELFNMNMKLETNIDKMFRIVMKDKKKRKTKKYLKKISEYKSLRIQFDHFISLIKEKKNSKLTKYATWEITNTVIENIRKLHQICPSNCKIDNDECGKDVLENIIHELREQKEKLDRQIYINYRVIRVGLIEYLDIIDGQKTDLEIKKILSKVSNRCNDDKLKSINIGRNIIWQLVNFTILSVEKPDSATDLKCWTEWKQKCKNFFLFPASTFRIQQKRAVTSEHSKCSAGVLTRSASECTGMTSNCWSPGVDDTDCRHNGLCCFDGCSNRCLDGPSTSADLWPGQTCRMVRIKKCRRMPRISQEFDLKIRLLNKIMKTEDKPKGVIKTTVKINTCDQSEHEQFNKYINAIDIILKSMKHSNKRTETINFGLIDLIGMFDSRLSRLFADKLCCYKEMEVIKRSLMPTLTQCSDDIMEDELTQDNSACIYDLREKMSTRQEYLLENIYKSSLSNISECSCECKISARNRTCLPECQQFSADPTCCFMKERRGEKTNKSRSAASRQLNQAITKPFTTTMSTNVITDRQNTKPDPTLTRFSLPSIYNNDTTSDTLPYYYNNLIPKPNCPLQCQLPSGIPWSVCPAECSRWSSDDSGVCCSPS